MCLACSIQCPRPNGLLKNLQLPMISPCSFLTPEKRICKFCVIVEIAVVPYHQCNHLFSLVEYLMTSFYWYGDDVVNRNLPAVSFWCQCCGCRQRIPLPTKGKVWSELSSSERCLCKDSGRSNSILLACKGMTRFQKFEGSMFAPYTATPYATVCEDCYSCTA